MTDLTPVNPQLRVVRSTIEDLLAAFDEVEMVGRADDSTVAELKAKLDTFVSATQSLHGRVRRDLPRTAPGVSDLLAGLQSAINEFGTLSSHAGAYLDARSSFHKVCQTLSENLGGLRDVLDQIS